MSDPRSNPKPASSGRRAVRTSLSAVLLSLVMITPSAAAPAKSAAASQSRPERRTYSAEESKVLGDKARQLAQGQQAQWDRKMKAVTGSICKGC